MKNMTIYEWLLLGASILAAACLLLCCDPVTETAADCGQLCEGSWNSETGVCDCPDPCPVSRRMNDGSCCPEGLQVAWTVDLPNEEMFEVCEPTGLGSPCTPTSGWQELYPDLCCRDDILTTCEPEAEACTPTSGWQALYPDSCCVDGFVGPCLVAP